MELPKALSLATSLILAASTLGADTVDYNRDVRPILAANCYACHGPDAGDRKAGLRLDERTAALSALKGGGHAVLPGKSTESAIIARVTATDPGDRMPPPRTGKSLTAKEVATLRAWIDQGAEWSEHWAYVTPKREKAPKENTKTWRRTAIDRFIRARLEREGLTPSAEADRVTLLRRLSLDLIGLPPTPAEVSAFLKDKSDDAYSRQVERLLASPHFGERMAMFWLDLVRFADTRGYHSDNPRNVYPYRDYVIRSFNENKRFDQFTIEQLAGDLLPEAGVEQRVATCYNKLNQTTEEGGAQPKEYEAKNSSDRVRNVSVVWMGATLGCAECHDHKFDPLSAKDFYSLAAFFADIKEPAIMDRDQGIRVPDPEQTKEIEKIAAEIAKTKAMVDMPTGELAGAVAKSQGDWEQSVGDIDLPTLGAWSSLGPFAAGDINKAFNRDFGPEKKPVDLKAKYGKQAWKARPEWADGKVHNLTGANSATYLHRTIDVRSSRALEVSLGSDDGIAVWLNGKPVLSKNVTRGVAPDQEKIKLPLVAGRNELLMKITNGGGGYGFYFKAAEDDGVPGPVRAVLKVARDERDDNQSQIVASFYRSIAPELEGQRKRITELEAKKAQIEKNTPYCVVSEAAAPRTVRILHRGNWMDTSGNVVEPAIPEYFGRLETEGRATRLDLAKWIVRPDNPLTARVFVNRLWKLFYGTGISSRLDDLGAMGEPPSHPELLDWLALEFVDSGWDVKHMIRLMVGSKTYRQSSVPTEQHARKDPYNRLLARQSRWRLDAETVRDGALAISGLLSTKIGGPSVKPYQPAGYWVHLNFPKRRWTADQGESLYRRGLYTWWQRSFLHPSLMAFDAPNREECTAERARSNIPQQALVLLNDPTYVEAARVFAHRIRSVDFDNSADSIDPSLRWAFRMATSRYPDDDETALLHDLFHAHKREFASSASDAEQLLGVGAAPSVEAAEAPDVAAWTSVARTILNLHETVTRN